MAPATPMTTSSTPFIPSRPTPIFEIMPGLYISHFPIRVDPRITHVLNIGKRPNNRDRSRKYLHVPMGGYRDSKGDLRNVVITTFVCHALKEVGTVLVHGFGDINCAAEAFFSFFGTYPHGPEAWDKLLRGRWGWGLNIGAGPIPFYMLRSEKKPVVSANFLELPDNKPLSNQEYFRYIV